MSKEKISSQEITDLLASKASVSKRAAEEFLKVMIATAEDALLAGEVVKIKNFGTFKLLWNEPRKSVNVQTGEEIMLAGYYKVAFVPDTALREQVNEPFAHLEPVVLDEEISPKEPIDETEPVSDPLRIFTEQASEIKDLISEIQALSPSSRSAVSEEAKTKPEEEKEQAYTNEEEKIENNDKITQDDPTLKSRFKEDDSKLINEEKTLIQTDGQVLLDKTAGDIAEEQVQSEDVESQLLSELSMTPYLENIKPIRRKKVWLWVLIILFLLTGISAGLYFFYPPANEFSKRYSVAKISEKVSALKITNAVSKWFSSKPKQTTKTVTVVIPKDINDFDSIRENQSVDSLQILFDNPRVYTKFIASEKIREGSRLTIMSKRYYGQKDFWVYIYEANKDRISNPDKIDFGTLIRIPKLDSRLIDVTNPRCLKKAKELHDIYVKQETP
jgi:nucleoid DNA-binding protein